MPPRLVLMALFVLGAAVAVALRQSEAAVILLGAALGALVVETVALEPIGDLLRKSAPLALPLLVIAVVGSINRDWWVALAAGVLFSVVAWLWIVRPDLAADSGGEKVALTATLRQFAVALGAVAVAIGVARLLLSIGFADTLGASDSIGGIATTLFVAGVVLWACALVIRLFSFGTNPARLTVWLALAAAFFLLVVSIGIVEGPDDLLGLKPPALLAIAGCALVVEIMWVIAKAAYGGADSLSDALVGTVGGWLRTGGLLERFWQSAGDILHVVTTRADRVGLITALLASAVLATATAVALVETADQGSDSRVPNSEGIRLEQGPAPEQVARSMSAARRNLALAKEYMPVLAFTADQRWTPIGVETYLDHPDPTLANAVLTGPVATRAATAASRGAPARICDPKKLVTPCEPRQVKNLPTTCPGLAKVPCYRLTITCPSGTLACADGEKRPSRTRHYRDGAVYVRVLARSRGERGSTADVFRDVGPYRRGEQDVLWMVVQYWYFYRYDEWKQRILPGNLVQRHEADWEAVTIGLAKDKPLFVGYSAHCGGRWQHWSPKQVPAARTGRPWTHPVVAVAEGSQANYPRAEQRRPPNWDGCSGIPGLKADLISYAANVRDRTGYDWQWKPRRIIPVTSEVKPMSFPGKWGGYDETRLVNNADLKPLAEGTGPATPSLQPLWQDPVGTIFCSAKWSGPRSAERRKAALCKPRPRARADR